MTNAAGTDPSQLEGERRLDRLVDLHVLAEHGDPDAADAAARWIVDDPEARRRWDQVEQVCATLRGAIDER